MGRTMYIAAAAALALPIVRAARGWRAACRQGADRARCHRLPA